MVNVLVGNKNSTELNILCQNLANDKNYQVDNITNGKDIINIYLKTNPDILILDDSISDMTIEDILKAVCHNG